MTGFLQRGKRSASSAFCRRSLCIFFLFLAAFLLAACDTVLPLKSTATSTARPPTATASSEPGYDFPAVNANYVYDQLYYMSMTFQQRESGFDLDPEKNGHKAFAQYWVQEMQQNLQGFDPQVVYDTFQGGWTHRPAESSSYNVEITIPGAVHPEQVIVVGSHYDGMHVSQGSAFDDTSGCAILLGEAKALGTYWRTHHLYPARTLRFVLFDAEEQGLLGSYHYVNSTINGDIGNLVAMINEEQSGFSYPVRFLGKASNPVIPLHIWKVSGHSQLYFASIIQSALPAVSKEMRTLGYTTVTYHGNHGQDVNSPVFTPDQLPRLVEATDPFCCSDEAAFDQANVPELTFIAGDQGNIDQSTLDPKIPKNELYPFDTHEDTIQLMNGYANGETKKSQALVLALGFQTMLQAWMLNQSGLVGNIAATDVPAGPLTTISDIGILQPGNVLKLEAQSAFDPRSAQSQLRYHWNFGDGTQADGAQVQHTYASSGKYTLTLAVQDANGTRQIRKELVITQTPPTYDSILSAYLQGQSASGAGVGDITPSPDFRLPPIIQNGDGLTSDDHFPGHNG